MTETEPELPESPGSASLRMRTDQELEERRQIRAAEAYAPPSGVGVVIDPDDQWRARNAPAS